MTGKIQRIFKDKGYGFISNGDKEYFFHLSSCNKTFNYLNVGDDVEFDECESPKGPRAENVKPLT